MPQPPKTVAFVLPALSAGGAERVLITLMNRLDRAAFRPVFVTLNDQGPAGAWVAQDIPFYSLHDRRLRNGLPGLLRVLRRISPDTVVSTMAHMNFGLLLLKPFLKPGTRFVVREANVPSSILGDAAHPFPGRALLVRAAYRLLYPWADVVVSPARRIIDEFPAVLGLSTHNHTLLYNPVDEDVVRACGTLSHPPERARTVTFVAAGRLHRQKGFDRLVAALSEGFSMPEGLDWRLEILGEGPERPALEAQIAASGLSDKIFLRGLISPPWPIIAEGDAFVLPSRWEGLPNVVLESLSAGTPVIASTQAGGIEEIAALAPRGAVTLAADMTVFVEAMRTVRPGPVAAPRPSLLPGAFRLPGVVEAFARLL